MAKVVEAPGYVGVTAVAQRAGRGECVESGGLHPVPFLGGELTLLFAVRGTRPIIERVLVDGAVAAPPAAAAGEGRGGQGSGSRARRGALRITGRLTKCRSRRCRRRSRCVSCRPSAAPCRARHKRRCSRRHPLPRAPALGTKEGGRAGGVSGDRARATGGPKRPRPSHMQMVHRELRVQEGHLWRRT